MSKQRGQATAKGASSGASSASNGEQDRKQCKQRGKDASSGASSTAGGGRGVGTTGRRGEGCSATGWWREGWWGGRGGNGCWGERWWATTLYPHSRGTPSSKVLLRRTFARRFPSGEPFPEGSPQENLCQRQGDALPEGSPQENLSRRVRQRFSPGEPFGQRFSRGNTQGGGRRSWQQGGKASGG